MAMESSLITVIMYETRVGSKWDWLYLLARTVITGALLWYLWYACSFRALPPLRDPSGAHLHQPPLLSRDPSSRASHRTTLLWTPHESPPPRASRGPLIGTPHWDPHITRYPHSRSDDRPAWLSRPSRNIFCIQHTPLFQPAMARISV